VATEERIGLELPPGERRTLLRLARAAIHEAIHHDGALQSALAGSDLTADLQQRRGVFVTLKMASGEEASRAAKLRGCIGVMGSSKPLYETVVDTAPRAAFHDPRFPPLTGEELPRVKISLSILSGMKPLADPESVIVGRDGLQLIKGPYRSVFLPQVPVEQGWSRERYLDQLARKAGLPGDGWRGAELSTFEALAFGE
jgi:AmmeMemoRadiSam system protein A